MDKPKIVVLGAGFAGLMAVSTLQKELECHEAEIILVNKHTYHFQRTWLHQVAGGMMHPNRVTFEIKGLLDENKVTFIKDVVLKLNFDEKKVILENSELSYDYLVIALGGELATYGIPGVGMNTFSISSVNEAKRIRNHIESKFATFHSKKEDEKITIVVGGGGFTSFEFIGELVNWIPTLCRKYQVDYRNVNIKCFQSSSYALPSFDQNLAEYAVNYLVSKGVEFRFNTPIKECLPDGVLVMEKGKNEVEKIHTDTVIWAVGVQGNSVIEQAEINSEYGRVRINPDLRAPDYDNVFVIGDCSIFADETSGEDYTPTAQIALQQGVVCAENIISMIRETSKITQFIPHIRGIVCSLGKENAVGIVYGKKLVGSKALLMKKIIDNRGLYMIGGSSLVLKKGKFGLFS